MATFHSYVKLPEGIGFSLVIYCNSLLLKPWPMKIVDLPAKDGDFPYQTVSLPEGNPFLIIIFWIVMIYKHSYR